jgi:hypothetical protein
MEMVAAYSEKRIFNLVKISSNSESGKTEEEARVA